MPIRTQRPAYDQPSHSGHTLRLLRNRMENMQGVGRLIRAFAEDLVLGHSVQGLFLAELKESLHDPEVWELVPVVSLTPALDLDRQSEDHAAGSPVAR